MVHGRLWSASCLSPIAYNNYVLPVQDIHKGLSKDSYVLDGIIGLILITRGIIVDSI